jgi:hypothetical protein
MRRSAGVKAERVTEEREKGSEVERAAFTPADGRRAVCVQKAMPSRDERARSAAEAETN